ncbi:MAG: PF20097 family protein [Clostridiales bacterium]|nr:PF20097 family protein [Clostridiales bacterium]
MSLLRTDKCPYCERVMKRGSVVSTRHRLYWMPEGGKMPSFAWNTPKGGVPLGTYDIFTGGEVDAYYCEECGKIVIEV